MNKEIKNISELNINQRVWYFSKYGEIKSGKIVRLDIDYAWNKHDDNGRKCDNVTIMVDEIDGVKRESISRCGIDAKQNMIYTSKPNENEYIDDRVEFSSDCIEDDCNGTINGLGWCDDDGVIIQFDYQECDNCDWNQAS